MKSKSFIKSKPQTWNPKQLWNNCGMPQKPYKSQFGFYKRFAFYLWNTGCTCEMESYLFDASTRPSALTTNQIAHEEGDVCYQFTIHYIV